MKEQKETGEVDVRLVLPRTSLPILAAVRAMGRDMMKQAGEEPASGEPELDPLEYYGECYMESLSEAGYSETPPANRLSIRAFGHLISVKPEDLEQVKSLLGYRRTAYRDFALCDTIISALGLSDELALALPLLDPGGDARPVGPFYPHLTKLNLAQAVKMVALQEVKDLEVSSNWLVPTYLARMVGLHKKSSHELSATDVAAIRLAGLFRVDLNSIYNELLVLILGSTDELSLRVALAYVVLAALRATPRLVAGLQGAQPKSQ